MGKSKKKDSKDCSACGKSKQKSNDKYKSKSKSNDKSKSNNKSKSNDKSNNKSNYKSSDKKLVVKSGFVDNNGVQLFYRWVRTKKHYKNKQTLVFVHGDDSNSVVWKCQQNYFAKYYNTLAIDMRGFGRSSKPAGPYGIDVHVSDLAFLFNQLGIQQMILVGWSMGGLVVQLYTLTYPDQVLKLVLVDTAPSVVQRPNFPYGRSDLEEAEIIYTIKNDFEKYAVKGAEACVPETCPVGKVVRRKIYELIKETGQETALKTTVDIIPFNFVDQIQNITCPTLIFVGALDGAISPNCSFFMRENIPNSHLIEFPYAGHSPFLTYTKEFNQYLLSFLHNNLATPCSDCPEFVKGKLVSN